MLIFLTLASEIILLFESELQLLGAYKHYSGYLALQSNGSFHTAIYNICASDCLNFERGNVRIYEFMSVFPSPDYAALTGTRTNY